MDYEEAEFTLSDFFEGMGFDQSNLSLQEGLTVATEMSPMLALELVNKWNKRAAGMYVYFIDPNA